MLLQDPRAVGLQRMGRLCMAEEMRLLRKESMLMLSVKDSQIWTEGRERPGKGHA